MSSFKALLVVLSCIVICHAMSLRSDTNKLKRAWTKHKKFASRSTFPCAVPQPRVFYLKDLVKEDTWKDVYESIKDKITPFATVLHRCESSGCCTYRNEKCLPSKSQDVNLVFAEEVNHHWHYFSLPAKNHTECACQKIQDNDIK